MIDIIDIFRQNGIELNNNQCKQFLKYYELLIQYNKVINLTTITDYDDVIIKHFLDSVLTVNDLKNNSSLIDIGTGAGFPAVPIKIIRPDINITLVDSLNKRINFLNIVINELELKNINAIHSRSEDLARNEYFREKYDYCVSRAVAKLNTLIELCIPFLKKNGILFAYKSLNYNIEIENAYKCLKKLNCEIKNIKNYLLPLDYGERNIIEIKKIKETSMIYPRKNNLPKNKPL